MKALLEKYMPLRAPDDPGGAGGGGSGDGGTPSAGAAAEPGKAGPEAAAAAAAAAAGAGQPYRPQGLAETMFGKDDRETIDKMANALKGYRDRDAAAGVPDKVDAYNTFEAGNVDAKLKPHIDKLAADPMFQACAQVAMEEGIPVGKMHRLVTTLYGKAIDEGVFEGFVDVAAERAALLPAEAKDKPKAEQDAAIDARMRQNEDFLKLLMKPGADGKSPLDAKVGEHALLMLMDTAAGNQFLEFFRASTTSQASAQPNAGGNGSGGGHTPESLRQRRGLPENTPGDRKFSQASYDQLQADYKSHYGE